MIPINNELTEEQKTKVSAFLDKAKPLLAANDFVIKINEKNIAFDREFSMKNDQKKDILKSLTVDDCVSVESNNNLNYDNSEVYKFLKNTTTYVYGELENVHLYIKMYIKEFSYYDKIIVISFHKEGVFE